MKLYARPGSFRAQKVLVAAELAGKSLAVESATGSLKGKAAADRLPLLETDKGCLFESNAIMRFVADGSALGGKDAFETAQINSWIDFSANEIEVPAQMWVGPIIGWSENYTDVTARATKDLKAALNVVEAHLKFETFLVGRSVTLADIAMAAALVLPMKLVLDQKTRKSFPCVTRWFETIANQPAFLKVVGPVTLVKKAVQASAPKKTAAAAAPKKAEKKKEEAAPAAPAKPADPFAAAPKAKMPLDSWKRQYSNVGDDCYKAMPWLWEKLAAEDKDAYSIWMSTYNYDSENKVGFQTSNLAGGFVQRCDAVRKHLFGTIQILGEEGKSPFFKIKACWLIKGGSIDPLIECNPDAEYHTFTRITDFNDENKQKIADMWCAEEKIDGEAIYDCKVFK